MTVEKLETKEKFQSTIDNREFTHASMPTHRLEKIQELLHTSNLFNEHIAYSLLHCLKEDNKINELYFPVIEKKEKDSFQIFVNQID